MLELRDIHVSYGSIRALNGVSLRVDDGELVALIGSNGAGKSTTLKTISGLLRARQGALLYEGQAITRAPTDRIVALGISHCPEGRRIFGRLTYRGRGVYGFTATGLGAPLDSYGRNIYVDTFNSRYGKGWHRENSFLTHHRGHTLGDFCYGFFPHFGHPTGQGAKYRATAEGPGVTPDVMWAADDIGAFDATVQQQMQSLERSWGDPKCRA
jgi:energy-coupling factor transporter ATP-binding protein EcfA2